MMIIRPSQKRGQTKKGWLDSRHTFSFDTYYDPAFTSYRAMRVLNEDIVKGGKGFGEHFHKEMEIVTYVIEGALEHKDSIGNTVVISAGEVQRMSAGTGVMHSEYNLSHMAPVHFFQMWFLPSQMGLSPSYAQKTFPAASKWGQWALLASNNGRGGSLLIHQDVDLYATLLDAKDSIQFETLTDRYYWLQIVSGQFVLHDGQQVVAGDGVAIHEEDRLEIKCLEGGEMLLFDLA